MICNWTLSKEKLFITIFCFFQALSYIIDLLQMLWIDFMCIDTRTRIFFSCVGAERDSFLSDMLFSSLLFDVHFSGIVFFFCRRGVTSLSSVSTRQTSYSHSKLTHNPKIFTASLSCVWHFLDFVLIKTLVLTCNKRKIILYFVGCSELIFITIFCFHYMHNSLKIFLHLHILPFNPNY